MRNMWNRSALLATALLLSACASVPRPQAPVAGVIGDEASSAWLRARASWSLEGRLAVSKGREGGNGRLSWNQLDGREYEVDLSAPITGKTWRLRGNTHYEAGTLYGLEGGPREGEFAEELLREATGLDIPVNQLPDWLRGLPVWDTPEAAEVIYDEAGRVRSIEQLGWKIDYLAWFEPIEGRPALPRRIEARSGDARVRLVVDRWDFAEP